MTIQMCVQICKAKSMDLALVKVLKLVHVLLQIYIRSKKMPLCLQGQHCACVEDTSNLEKLPSSECDMKCPGETAITTASIQLSAQRSPRVRRRPSCSALRLVHHCRPHRGGSRPLPGPGGQLLGSLQAGDPPDGGEVRGLPGHLGRDLRMLLRGNQPARNRQGVMQ